VSVSVILSESESPAVQPQPHLVVDVLRAVRGREEVVEAVRDLRGANKDNVSVAGEMSNLQMFIWTLRSLPEPLGKAGP
jgi:hypothetical protein